MKGMPTLSYAIMQNLKYLSLVVFAICNLHLSGYWNLSINCDINKPIKFYTQLTQQSIMIKKVLFSISDIKKYLTFTRLTLHSVTGQ